MKKRLLLAIAATLTVTTLQAQLADGSYVLYQRGLPNSEGGYTYYDAQNDCLDLHSITLRLGGTSCASLYVSGQTIYFATFSAFDTGNTFGSTSGDYEVALTPIAENVYEGKNELIDLALEVNEDGSLELLVKSRVVYKDLITYCVDSFSGNSFTIENTKYVFKREDVQTVNLATEEKPGLKAKVKSLGVAYGAYRVTDTCIVFEA